MLYDVTDVVAPVRLEELQLSGTAGDYVVDFTDTLGGERRFIARAGPSQPAGSLPVDQPSTLADAANGADLIVLAYRDLVD